MLLASVVSLAEEDEAYEIAIPAQSLAGALQSLAEQIDVQIVFFSGATEGLTAEELSGSYTRLQALNALLAGTGLRYVFLNRDSVAIQPVPEVEQAAPAKSARDPSPALATETDSFVPHETPTEEFAMDEIVVTGTGSKTRTKYASSVGISTFDRADIERQLAASTADLISAVPGFWVESTAGTTHGNVFARGIVQDGGYRYVGLVEDGLPVYPVFELSFYNPDQFIRVSESTARVEVVRGGTAPIFTSGAVGGTINFINEEASASPGLRLKAAYSDFDTRALDAHWSAPLSETWHVSAGGYLRASDGLRNPGYVADEGGQLRVELERKTPRSALGLYAKYIDDRSLFVVPIPLRGSATNPSAVDGSSAGEYSLHSNDIRRAGLPPSADEVGLGDSDLADGIHPRLLTVGIRGEFRWDSGASLTSHTRLTSGDVSFNGIFTGDVPVTGLDFAAERGVAADYSTIASGDSFDPTFLVQNHGHWAIAKEYQAIQNDTRLNLVLSQHDLTIGAYFADFSMSDRWSLGNLLLTDVRDQPQRLFLPGVTDSRGFTQYSFLNLRADYDGIMAAVYLADEWHASDRLRFDLGVRFDTETIDSSISDGMENVDLDGDPETTYDIVSLAGTARTNSSEDFSHASYSAGFNYEITERHALFGHLTRSAKLPHFDDIRNGITSKDGVTNAEFGYKTSLEDLALFLTTYSTEFDSVPFNDILADGSIIVRQARTRTYGVELEGVYEPVETVALQFSATLQDPEYRNFSGATVSNSGNQVRRIPRLMIRAVPSIEFAGGRGRAFLSLSHYGKRFANDENTIELPSYLKLDAGVQYAFNEHWSAQLNVDNLSDEVGLTEGNPRTDVGSSGVGQLYNARTLFGRSLAFAVRYTFQPG
ncbi:MAG TPA: TonB-dependent receptor [Woeseiaceae bacterium]|nr:TonB-dependent receptor [Woeseiaceae bacterium]